MKTSLPKLADLEAAFVNVTPVSADWSTGYGERWDFTEAKRLSDVDDNADPSDIRTNHDGDGYALGLEGPMMSYYYPLPEWAEYGMSAEDTARALVDLPLCLVHFEESDEYGLALTGGGMDLSPEICEAFITLGYLPPFHFAANLPAMAGRWTSARDKAILAACRKSCQVVKMRAGNALRRLRELGNR